MLDNIYWVYDEKNVYLPCFKKLLLVGQSGAGKTTLARYLCKRYPDKFEIIKNCTTRPRRLEDEDNFYYLSNNEFNILSQNNEFFLARQGSFPLYGYKKNDYKSIVINKKIPIFMFRLSGLKHLKNLLKNYCVVFILSEINASMVHSNDQNLTNLADESAIITKEIKNEIKEFSKRNEKFYIVKNNYDEKFFEQIDRVVISEF